MSLPCYFAVQVGLYSLTGSQPLCGHLRHRVPRTKLVLTMFIIVNIANRQKYVTVVSYILYIECHTVYTIWHCLNRSIFYTMMNKCNS